MKSVITNINIFINLIYERTTNSNSIIFPQTVSHLAGISECHMQTSDKGQVSKMWYCFPLQFIQSQEVCKQMSVKKKWYSV